MKEKIFNILKLIFCLICFFLTGTFIIYCLKILKVDLTNISLKAEVFLQFIISLFIMLIFIIVYRSDIKKDFNVLKKNKSKYISYIIKMFILFFIIKYLVTFLSAIIIQFLNYDIESVSSMNQTLIEEYLKQSPILMAISCAILAPFYEEVLFRLGLKKVIKNKYIFVIISGSIFGLMHVFPLEEGVTLTLGLIQSISYVTMGLFLAYIYQKTDNIFCSIGLHFLNNFISIITLLNML